MPQAKQLDGSEIAGVRVVMIKALNKYPETLLLTNLKSVYFLKDMKFFSM